jgi:hypothetical protein
MPDFRFLDDSDAQRQLGIDRITLEELIRTGRLKAVSRSGENIYFFRAAEIARVRAELYPDDDNSSIETDKETVTTPPDQNTSEGTRPKKQRDPAMRVHQRLTADLKWYDISDDDIAAWLAELRPDSYDRQESNARYIISRMQQIIDMIEEGRNRSSP